MASLPEVQEKAPAVDSKIDQQQENIFLAEIEDKVGPAVTGLYHGRDEALELRLVPHKVRIVG